MELTRVRVANRKSATPPAITPGRRRAPGTSGSTAVGGIAAAAAGDPRPRTAHGIVRPFTPRVNPRRGGIDPARITSVARLCTRHGTARHRGPVADQTRPDQPNRGADLGSTAADGEARGRPAPPRVAWRPGRARSCLPPRLPPFSPFPPPRHHHHPHPRRIYSALLRAAGRNTPVASPTLSLFFSRSPLAFTPLFSWLPLLSTHASS